MKLKVGQVYLNDVRKAYILLEMRDMNRGAVIKFFDGTRTTTVPKGEYVAYCDKAMLSFGDQILTDVFFVRITGVHHSPYNIHVECEEGSIDIVATYIDKVTIQEV